MDTTVTSFSRSRARKVALRENASPSPRPGRETEDVARPCDTTLDPSPTFASLRRD